MAITTKEAPKAAATSFVVLELFKYSRYVRIDTLYEKGVPYKFTPEQAEILLDETDEVTGMPVWKRYKSPQQTKVVVREVQPMDMTAASIKPAEVDEVAAAKRVEIGDDSDLDGLLPGADEEVHNV